MNNLIIPDLDNYRHFVDQKLSEFLALKDNDVLKVFSDAMRYSLLSGGKRIRATLLLEFSRICGSDLMAVVDVACAVEMLHAYSLAFEHPRTHQKMTFQAPLPEDFLKGLKNNGVGLPDP